MFQFIIIHMRKNPDRDYDIIIVGAGIVGLTIAKLFGNTALSVALIDKNEPSSHVVLGKGRDQHFDPRVSALSIASKNILKDLNAWHSISQGRLCDYRDMQVWDADGTGQINFSAKELGHQELGVIVENSLLLSALTKALAKETNIDFLFPYSIAELVETKSNVKLKTTDGIEITTKLVIAADGSNSKIRDLAGFSIREWDYDHHAIVTTVKTQQAHGKVALQRFIETGPLAFLPLLMNSEDEDQNYCSIVWSATPERANELMGLDNAEFCKDLNQSIECRFGEIISCAERYCFPLKQRHALEYAKGKIVLAGDAAHSIHPLAGQGVNLGFLDAVALVSEVSDGLDAGREIFDPVVLNRYQRKRQTHNLSTMWLMEGFKRLFAENALSVRWLRNLGMNGLDSLPAAKNYLARRAMGINS
ncbi:MAG: UbiH/UbiF/VisC/COQ6 family ubiquinone biosynthesis hydroxylase [Gammaproteobacteria bacterium]|nr:UbiH/UbiF/VisC/COQ6 family ubiquinone biosynthesis hydroxylase [Gammaproteobacteria bacterium]